MQSEIHALQGAQNAMRQGWENIFLQQLYVYGSA